MADPDKTLTVLRTKSKHSGAKLKLMKLLAILLLSVSLLAQRAETLLQSGVKKETVDGNLPGAIEDYKKAAAAAKSDRPLAAKALFALAQCYRKQGDVQAKSALERIVREFADQPVAAQARVQLSAFNAKPAGIRLQKIRSGMDYGCSSVSADGKLLACGVNYVDDAAVYDVETGKVRILTTLRKETPANRYINSFSISPDGKWLAFHVYRAGAVFSELAVVPTDGSGAARTVFKHSDGRWLDVHTWTPDSKEILISIPGRNSGERFPLMTVALATGATRTIRELRAKLQWAFIRYSPDGKWLAIPIPDAEPNTHRVEIWNAAGEFSALVSSTDRRDSIAGWAPDGRSLFVTSSHNGQASLLEVPVVNGKIAGQTRAIRSLAESIGRPMGIDSNGTLYFTANRSEADLYSVPFNAKDGTITETESPGSTQTLRRRAFGNWSPDGKSFASWTFDRYNNNGTVTRPQQLIVRTLPAGPETIAIPETPAHPFNIPTWDAESKSLLMLIADGAPDLYRLARLHPLTGKVTPVSVPISMPNIGFTPSWTADGRYIYQRKDDSDIHQIDAQSGAQRLLYSHLPEESGVRYPVVSPDGKWLAFSGATRVMKGAGEWTATSSRWIKVMEIATGSIHKTEGLAQLGWGAGVIAWSPDGRFLVFAAHDKQQQGIWITPADGGAAPRRLSSVSAGRALHLAFAPGGKTLTYTLDTYQEDIWALSGFLGAAQ